jgi:hypothetical protein
MICTAAHRRAIDLRSAQMELPTLYHPLRRSRLASLANTLGNGLDISHLDVPGMYSVQQSNSC